MYCNLEHYAIHLAVSELSRTDSPTITLQSRITEAKNKVCPRGNHDKLFS